MLIIKHMKTIQAKFVKWFNNYFGRVSFNNAIKKCTKIHNATGKKMYIVMLNQEYMAIPKQEFKIMWAKNPAMKIRTLAEWQNYIYEFNPNSQPLNTAA